MPRILAELPIWSRKATPSAAVAPCRREKRKTNRAIETLASWFQVIKYLTSLVDWRNHSATNAVCAGLLIKRKWGDRDGSGTPYLIPPLDFGGCRARDPGAL